MDRGTWLATVHMIAKVGHGEVTEHACKPPYLAHEAAWGEPWSPREHSWKPGVSSSLTFEDSGPNHF